MSKFACGAAAAAVAFVFAGPGYGQTSPAPIWSHESLPLQQWSPTEIAVGNRGSKVLMHVGPYTDYTRVFDSYVPSGQPSWEAVNPYPTMRPRVASAETRDLQATLFQEFVGGSPFDLGIVLKVRSALGIHWEYRFPFTNPGTIFIDVEISRDGRWLVAAAYQTTTSKTWVASFDTTRSNPSQPVTYTGLSALGQGIHLDGSGRRLFVESTTHDWVLDPTQTGAGTAARVLSDWTVFQGVASSGSISRDGTKLAYATYSSNSVMLLSEGPNGYAERFSYSPALSSTVLLTALSGDASELAIARYDASRTHVALLETLDVPASIAQAQGIPTRGLSYSNPLGLQNRIADLDYSDSGARLAVATWGDGAGPSPEIFIYDPGSSFPVTQIRLPGSGLCLDLSGDGLMLAVGTYMNHATDFTGGGRVQAYEVGERDLVLRGRPVMGGTLDVRIHGRSNQPAILLMSSGLGSPLDLGPLGVLLLDRQRIYAMPPVNPGSDGWSSWPVTLSAAHPSGLFAPGRTVSFQGLVPSSRMLTHDAISVTIE